MFEATYLPQLVVKHPGLVSALSLVLGDDDGEDRQALSVTVEVEEEVEEEEKKQPRRRKRKILFERIINRSRRRSRSRSRSRRRIRRMWMERGPTSGECPPAHHSTLGSW